MFRHGKNSHASATPACDGTRVFVATINSGALVVTAIDFDGTRLWQKPVGKFTSTWGYGSSPCLAGPFVVVNGEQSKASFVAALDRITGEIAWREPRPDGQNGSYGTPVAAEVAGKMQLLLAGPEVIMSHDPMTGKVIWSCRTSATQFANTIAFSNDMVFYERRVGHSRNCVYQGGRCRRRVRHPCEVADAPGNRIRVVADLPRRSVVRRPQ